MLKLLNIEIGEIKLIISYESQKIKILKCKMTDKIKDILSLFAEREKVDYSSFLILYSGNVIQGPDLEKTFSQIITKNDKQQKTMNILIYSQNPALIPEQNFIKIILIINSKNVIELQGKKNETIKEIINKNIAKIGRGIDSLIIKYDMNEINLNKKFEEIANERDKKYSGMTLSAYTKDDRNKLPGNGEISQIEISEKNENTLKVEFIDKNNNQIDIIKCKTGDKIKDVIGKFCLKKGININHYKYKIPLFNDVGVDQTFEQLFNATSIGTEAGLSIDANNNANNIPDEIQIKVIEKTCIKKYKKTLIIISIIIFIILMSSIIIYIILKPEPNIIPPEPEPSAIINDTILINDTIITTNIINNTTLSSVIINETIIDSTKEAQIIITTNKREPKICDSGYYIPDNDITLEDCQKCSVKGCIKCHGTYESNICTDCGQLKSVYDNNHNKIIECSNSCETGEEEKCLTCYEDKLGCKSCNIGYKLVNGVCRPDHLIKALYNTDKEGDLITLFNSASGVNKLIIDGENVSIKNEYQFPKKGNHTLYIKFTKTTSYYSNNNYFFSGNENLISVVFSDFDEYISDISFEKMFYSCTSLISVDLSRISMNLNSRLNGMFAGCTNLIYVNFNFKSLFVAISMDEMFMNCKLLTSLDLSIIYIIYFQKI